MWAIIKEVFTGKTYYEELFDSAIAYTKMEFKN